jgi:hypothetical protein
MLVTSSPQKEHLGIFNYPIMIESRWKPIKTLLGLFSQLWSRTRKLEISTWTVSALIRWHRVDVKMRIDWFGSDARMSTFIRPERRELNKEERLLLEWLIANGNADARQYASQIAGISVVGTCTCGCPTIDLATVDIVNNKKTAPSHILADFVGKTPEGIEVGVILHAREGAISELEVYAIPDVTGPFSLPSIESLKQF